MSIDITNVWHKRARPNPDSAAFNVQLGCHFEEIAEMVESMTIHVPNCPDTPGAETLVYAALKDMADFLKRGQAIATITDRENFLKELCDQIVTATGVGYCAGMDVPAAVDAVNRSNFSKFDSNGQPVRDANGKITKGPDYAPANLDGLY